MSLRVNARLAQDHAAVINPNTETPFSDAADVLDRLLPYHVFQQPGEDLDRKGKRKADDVATEIEGQLGLHSMQVADIERFEETKFALECFKRKRSLERRFRRVRTHSGKVCSRLFRVRLRLIRSQRPAPDEQAVALAQAVLEAERSETTLLNNELRSASTLR